MAALIAHCIITREKLWSKPMGWVMAALIAHSIILPGKNSGMGYGCHDSPYHHITREKLWSKSLGWVMAALIAHTII